MTDFLPFDSKSVTFHEDELGEHPNSYNGWSEEYAQIAIKYALKTFEYSDIEGVKFTKYFSRDIEENNGMSTVCYVETSNLGFYFVMRALTDQITVVYNRWD
jgi:hypothetical protein